MQNSSGPKKAIVPEEIKNILILQLGGIGDLALSVPALKAIRQRFNKSCISLLVISRSSELIRESAYIDRLFVFDIYYTNILSLFKGKALVGVLKTIRQLRRSGFDMAVNLENIASFKGALKMALLFWLIGPKYKVGRDTDGRGFFFDLKIKENSRQARHEVEFNLDVARALGASVSQINLELPIGSEEKDSIREFLCKNNFSQDELIFGLNPYAFNPLHRWPRQRWADLADRLIEEYHCRIIFIGQDGDGENIRNITRDMKNASLAVTQFNLRELTALIARFNLFITNETGPMHIAAAVQTPMVVLFGPTDINKFSPYCRPDKCQILRKELSCRDKCDDRHCRQNNMCLDLISVEDVLEAVRRILHNA
jgi:ADP-heptose:LPS heptosyltransferase